MGLSAQVDRLHSRVHRAVQTSHCPEIIPSWVHKHSSSYCPALQPWKQAIPPVAVGAGDPAAPCLRRGGRSAGGLPLQRRRRSRVPLRTVPAAPRWRTRAHPCDVIFHVRIIDVRVFLFVGDAAATAVGPVLRLVGVLAVALVLGAHCSFSGVHAAVFQLQRRKADWLRSPTDHWTVSFSNPLRRHGSGSQMHRLRWTKYNLLLDLAAPCRRASNVALLAQTYSSSFQNKSTTFFLQQEYCACR